MILTLSKLSFFLDSSPNGNFLINKAIFWLNKNKNYDEQKI